MLKAIYTLLAFNRDLKYTEVKIVACHYPWTMKLRAPIDKTPLDNVPTDGASKTFKSPIRHRQDLLCVCCRDVSIEKLLSLHYKQVILRRGVRAIGG